MILITGITGTSGKPFYEILCREGYDEDIRVVVRKKESAELFKNSPLNLQVVVGDVMDEEFMEKAVQGCNMVFHIAGKNKNNALISAVKKSGQVKKIILVSSTVVYSENRKRARLRGKEKRFIDFFEKEEINYCFIRPTMIFGTTTDGNISEFARWIKKYPIFPVVGHGSGKIQPVSCRDVAQAYWLILKNFENLKEKEYIVSGKEPMTILEGLKIISDMMGKKVHFVNVPFKIAEFAVQAMYRLSFKRKDYREKLERLTENRAFPNDTIKNELGYSPASFAERVAPLVEEIKKGNSQ